MRLVLYGSVIVGVTAGKQQLCLSVERAAPACILRYTLHYSAAATHSLKQQRLLVDMNANVPSIRTQRLVLRAWSTDDFEQYARCYANQDNARYVGGQKDREQARRHLAMQIGHWLLKGFGY
jgi:hypothetical protein